MLANQYINRHEQLVDLRETCNHPISLLYSEIFSASLHCANIYDGRIQPYFPVKASPFCRSVEAGMMVNKNEIDLTALSIALEAFYKEFHPNSIDAWFGLQSQNPTLLSQPPWAAIPPWRARSLNAYRDAVADAACRELGHANDHGTDPGLLWGKCGPVLPEVIDNEAQRLAALVKSVSAKGYQRSDDKDGDIVATALIHEDDSWVWLVTSGYHRACVLAALGYEEVTIRINKVVVRRQWKFWPHVLDGLYSEADALTIFDNIFAGIGIYQGQP